MQIAYQDFLPLTVKEAFLTKEFEKLPDIVMRANEWIKDSAIDLINVETVFMLCRESPDATVLNGALGDGYYLVRVWYRV